MGFRLFMDRVFMTVPVLWMRCKTRESKDVLVVVVPCVLIVLATVIRWMQQTRALMFLRLMATVLLTTTKTDYVQLQVTMITRATTPLVRNV